MKNPGFTLIAALTLALGIGANSALFGLSDAVMLRTLTVPRPEELALVATRTSEGGLHPDFSYPLYAALRDNNDVFAGMLASSDASFGLSSGSQTERARGEYVSANLLLARGQTRRREIGVRLALGASRGRIVRQLLVESLLLALAGGGLGLLIALWSKDLTANLRTRVGGALTLDNSLNWRVLVFTLAVTLVAALLFGLFPAFRAARIELAMTMKDGAVSSSFSARMFSLRNMLVVAQVALSIIMLVGAGLFLRSLWKLRSIDVGFSGERVLALTLDLRLQGYSQAQGKNFYNAALEKLGAAPGVQAVSLASVLPVTAGGSRLQRPPNLTRPAVNEPISIDIVTVTPQFFETLELPLLRGRDFRSLDSEASGRVIIVNEMMAQKFWPNTDPVGQYFYDGSDNFEVIGVARATKYRDLREEPRMTMYRPLAQEYSPGMNLLARTALSPTAMNATIRAQLGSLDPALPVFGFRTLPEHIAPKFLRARAACLPAASRRLNLDVGFNPRWA